jgi:anti-sigma B factor antagonist
MATQSDNDTWFRQDDFLAEVRPQANGSVKVTLAGEFDLSTAADLRGCLSRSEVLDANRIDVDLTGVSFLDSSSIGLLVATCKRVRVAGSTFSVECGTGPARRVLEISGLIEYLQAGDAA